MKKDYLTTDIKLQSINNEVLYNNAIKDLETLQSLKDEKEILKFIANKLIAIEQKLG